MSRYNYCLLGLGIAICLLFALNLLAGSVHIPPGDVCAILMGDGSVRDSWQFIILESRLPQSITALLSGAALSVSGLLLQTAFKNPLAGPDVFGINGGAGLGVALVMLLFGGSLVAGTFSLAGSLAVLVAAFAGAMAVTALLLFFSTLVRNRVLLLIVGIMVGYLSSSVISLLNFFATEEGVKSYLVWGMGHFGGVSMSRLPLFASLVGIGLVGSLMLVKPLNLIMLGEMYAENLGICTARVRNQLLVVTGLLTAVVTAYCGPVAFIGLAVPHVARLLLGTDDHRWLLPTTMLAGASVALLCNVLCFLPGEGGMIPLNAVTPLIGAPVVIFVILRKHG